MRSEGKNVLTLDAGNLFFLQLPKNKSEREESIGRVDVLIQAYNAMGYDGLNIGEKDLLLGYQFLSEVAKKATFPFISSNLTNKNEDSPIFASHIIKNISDMKIGIIGLIDPRLLKRGDLEVMASDPFKEAKHLVGDLRQQCDIIIALSQLGEARDRKLAMAVPEIDLIIGGVKSKTVGHSRIRDTIMVRLIPRGGYLGVLDLNIQHKGHPYRFSDLGHRDELLQKIERILFQYSLIEEEIDELPSKQKKAKLRELEILKQRERELQTRISSYDGKNTFKNQVIPINLRVADDPPIASLVEEHQRITGQKGKTGKPGSEE